jgi:Flp pilus assembly protein TadD
MSPVDRKIILAAAALLLVFSAVTSSAAVKPEESVCDVAADVALGLGDYSTAIELHRRLLLSEGNNARAHYHLGFAYGMMGRTAEEISEYRAAIGLGLKNWDLFLNLGLAYFDRHEIENATAAFETAVALGPQHAETHFNLAVVYERESRLHEALREIVVSLSLAPDDLDAANTDAIICARMGNLVFARNIWKELVEAAPEYAPARTNLAILNRSCGGACASYSHSHSPKVASQASNLKGPHPVQPARSPIAEDVALDEFRYH